MTKFEEEYFSFRLLSEMLLCRFKHENVFLLFMNFLRPRIEFYINKFIEDFKFIEYFKF